MSYEQQQADQRRVEDIKILQKINAAHRVGFIEKFPNQCEHILRLITERLHLCLDKRIGGEPNDPSSWKITAQEVESLAKAMRDINEIRLTLNKE